MIISAKGDIEWTVEGLKTIQDSWLLENGNYLFSHRRGIKEIAPDRTVVWEYNVPRGAELHSVQPLPNGKLLACECGTKRLIELDRTGTISKEIPLQTDQKTHLQFRTARKTSRGTYLVAFVGDSKVQEVDGTGAILNQWVTSAKPKCAHGVQDLPNGHLLVSTGNDGGVNEFDASGKRVWNLTKEDLLKAGAISTGYAGGIQRLPNGNTLVAMLKGNPQFFEVTPAKKIVWQYYNPEIGGMAGFRLLDQ